jgi:hypothetical protein
LRTRILNYKNRKQLLGKTESENSGYLASKEIGLLFKIGDSDLENAIEHFRKKLEADGKKVVCIAFSKDAAKVPVKEFPVFGKDHFTLRGELKNQEISDFCKRKPDFLFHIGFDSNPYLDFVLATSQAKCRVGFYRNKAEAFYDFMIKSDPKAGYDALIDELYRYTKNLKNEQQV